MVGKPRGPSGCPLTLKVPGADTKADAMISQPSTARGILGGEDDIARHHCISYQDAGTASPFSDCRRLAPFCKSALPCFTSQTLLVSITQVGMVDVIGDKRCSTDNRVLNLLSGHTSSSLASCFLFLEVGSSFLVDFFFCLTGFTSPGWKTSDGKSKLEEID